MAPRPPDERGGRPARPAADHDPVKRSLSIAGHATSVRLERAFWAVLDRIAAAEGRSLAALVADIDRDRPASLASALRVFALRRLQETAGGS